MEAAFRAILTSYAALTALVPAARIVWNHLPQSTQRPAIVLYKVAGVPGITHNGPDRLMNALVQLDIQTKATGNGDEPFKQLGQIRDAVMARLHGYHTDPFKIIVAQNERQDSEEVTGGLIQRSSIDFSVWHLAGD